MKAITDERVRFYLEHEDLIRTWAALEDDVMEAARAFLEEVARDLEAGAAELGREIRTWSQLDSGYPRVLIHEADWPVTDAGPPLVGVALEWYRSKVTFGPRHPPYVGVKVERGDPRGPALVDVLRERLAPTRKEHDYECSGSTTSWPAWRYVPAPDGYVDDLGLYRDALAGALHEAWRLCSGHVAAALRERD